VIFGRASLAAIAWAFAALAAVVLFVVLYEQPTLRRKFGADYDLAQRDTNDRLRCWL
jgi:protein-S-isoprenylcysteine O-methyltransferase Ste14